MLLTVWMTCLKGDRELISVNNGVKWHLVGSGDTLSRLHRRFRVEGFAGMLLSSDNHYLPYHTAPFILNIHQFHPERQPPLKHHRDEPQGETLARHLVERNDA
jgi:hypothetical protein